MTFDREVKSCQGWGHVGSCFGRGHHFLRLGRFLGTLWPTLARLRCFGGVLDRVGVDFGRFWGGPGKVLEAWELHFRGFSLLLRLVCVKTSTFTKHWQEQ